jgi:hypothetical protein
MARYFGVPLRNGLPIGLGSAIGLSGPVDPDFAADNIELEDGADLLLESGGLILLEGLMPTLWLDFQYSTSLDSRITFTRASTATYFNSSGVLTTAASGAARFDYNPSTLQPLGLLIEEARTNLLLQSEDFSTTWAATGATVSTNATTAPSGSATADKLVAGSGISVSPTSVSAFVRQDISKAATATTYTFSLFSKVGEFNAVRLFARDDATSANNAAVTALLTDGTVLTAASAAGTFTNASVVITNVGNGWYRVALTFTTSTETALRLIYSVGDSSSTTGDASKGIFIWGAQLEAGAFATSYIPTTTTALTRSADVASMTGTNFSSWYSASEGTLLADFTPVGAFVAARVAASLNDGSTANFMYVGTRNASATYGANNRVSSGTIVAIGSFGAANTSNQKATFAYSSAGQAVTFNAAAVATATETVPTVTQMNFGGVTTVSASTYIRRIAFYPTRLPDATLQGLTA